MEQSSADVPSDTELSDLRAHIAVVLTNGATPARKALLQSLIHEVRVERWESVIPWFRVRSGEPAKGRALGGLVAPAGLELPTRQQAVAGGLAALARLGRAAGVHRLLATQRPDAEAVPGQLKANGTGTLAFRARTAVNSWMLLDGDRAAHLPPHPGRALWVTDTATELQVPACDRATSDAWVLAGARASALTPDALARQRAQTASPSSDGVLE
ncbi:MAG TPA: hypothetical protein VNF24_07115 [Candidatus Acidoferrales bacterium]|nr:hypothetical protein [Candidatus Acidoferrales bacterium]